MYIKCIVQCAAFNVHVQCVLFRNRCAVYNVIVDGVLSSVHWGLFILRNVQWTLFITLFSSVSCAVCTVGSASLFSPVRCALCSLRNVHCVHCEMCIILSSNVCCAVCIEKCVSPICVVQHNLCCSHCGMCIVCIVKWMLYCSHCGMCIPPCRFTLRSRCHLSISLHRPLNNWHKINTKHKHGTWTVGTYYQPQKFKEPKLQFDLSMFGFGTAWGHPSCQFWIDSLKQPFHFTWYLEVWFRVTQTWGILMIIWPDTWKTGIYEKLAHVWATCAVNFLRQGGDFVSTHPCQ